MSKSARRGIAFVLRDWPADQREKRKGSSGLLVYFL